MLPPKKTLNNFSVSFTLLLLCGIIHATLWSWSCSLPHGGEKCKITSAWRRVTVSPYQFVYPWICCYGNHFHWLWYSKRTLLRWSVWGALLQSIVGDCTEEKEECQLQKFTPSQESQLLMPAAYQVSNPRWLVQPHTQLCQHIDIAFALLHLYTSCLLPSDKITP